MKPLNALKNAGRRGRFFPGILALVMLGGWLGCAADKSPTLHVKITVMDLDKQPSCLVLDPGSPLALISCREAGIVDVVNFETHALVQQLKVRPQPSTLLSDKDNGQFFCLYPVENVIACLQGVPLRVGKNLSTGSIALASASLRTGFSELWICDGISAVHVLLAKTLQIKSRIQVGRYPQHVAFSRDGATAFVTLKGENALGVIDVAKGAEVARIKVGIYPRDVLLVGNTICVSNYGSDDISLVDAVKRVETARIPVRREPDSLAVQGSTLWVSCEDSYRLVAVDVTQAKVIGTIKLKFYPGQICALPNGSLAVLDAQHNQVAFVTPEP